MLKPSTTRFIPTGASQPPILYMPLLPIILSDITKRQNVVRLPNISGKALNLLEARGIKNPIPKGTAIKSGKILIL